MVESQAKTIRSPLRRWAALPNRCIAVADEPREVTYRELARQVTEVTANLRKIGIDEGDVVATVCSRSVPHIVVLWAIWHAGAIAAPLSTRLPPEQIEVRLKTIGAKLLITDGAKMPQVCKTVRSKVLTSTVVSSEPERLFDLQLPRRASLIYTSGSSGSPKAVAHSLGNHVWSADGSSRNIPIQKGDRWLLSLPLYHVGGLAILFRCMLAGATVELSNVASLNQRIHEGVTHLSLVSTQLKRLVQRGSEAPESLQAVLLGGGSISPELVREASAGGWPIHTTYGLSEMASQVTTTRPGATADDLATAGKLLPYRELKIASDGEILVRGRTLFEGYFEYGQLERPFDEEGWFATGDRGWWDERDRLLVVGRKDQLINSGGENIQPEEIEQVLQASLQIARAVVVGVPHDEFGERPVAFVVWTGPDRDEERLRRRLRNKLEGFKVPDRIYELPEEMRGGLKVSRKELQAMADMQS